MAKKKKKIKLTPKIVLFSIIFILIGGVIGFTIGLLNQKNNITYSLNGNDLVYIELNSNYVDEGITIKNKNKDLSNKVKTTTNLNTSIIGTYYINYSYNDFFRKDINITRIIIVGGQIDE